MESRGPASHRLKPSSLKLTEDVLEAIKLTKADQVLSLLKAERALNKRLVYTEGHETREFTPLCMAIEYSDVHMVRQLLQAGADPEKHSFKTSRAPWGRMYISHVKMTPLYLAVRKERVDIIHLLIEQGACPNQPWGYCRENEEEGGSSVDYMEVEEEQDGRHDTVLHVAMRHNLPAAAAALLDSGADAVCINQRGESPLHLACQHGTACPLVQQMVRHGGICQQRDASGLTPLQHFVSSFISSSGEGRDLKQVTFTLTYLLDAGYTLDAEVWLRNLRQIRSNSNIPLQTWSLNFIYRALISNLGEDTLQMLLDWSYHVKSLSTLSRIAVRRTLGAVMVRKKIEALPLPHAIKMSL